VACLRHANIVGLLGVCCQEEPLYAVLEYMKHGDLRQFLQARVAAESSLGRTMATPNHRKSLRCRYVAIFNRLLSNLFRSKPKAAHNETKLLSINASLLYSFNSDQCQWCHVMAINNRYKLDNAWSVTSAGASGSHGDDGRIHRVINSL